MGEEFGETNPFHDFTSHGDEDLINAVREGRKREFQGFSGWTDHLDPQGLEVFENSRLSMLDPGSRIGSSLKLYAFYRELIRIRKSHPALVPPSNLPGPDCRLLPSSSPLLLVRREGGGEVVLIVGNLSALPQRLGNILSNAQGRWSKVLDSEEERWGGGGSLFPERLEFSSAENVCAPYQVALYLGVAS
jgi:maltooligosyltrehalose trehalohydrolase